MRKRYREGRKRTGEHEKRKWRMKNDRDGEKKGWRKTDKRGRKEGQGRTKKGQGRTKKRTEEHEKRQGSTKKWTGEHERSRNLTKEMGGRKGHERTKTDMGRTNGGWGQKRIGESDKGQRSRQRENNIRCRMDTKGRKKCEARWEEIKKEKGTVH
jgi:hypothetical protein